jgi:hypothetical protein
VEGGSAVDGAALVVVRRLSIWLCCFSRRVSSWSFNWAMAERTALISDGGGACGTWAGRALFFVAVAVVSEAGSMGGVGGRVVVAAWARGAAWAAAVGLGAGVVVVFGGYPGGGGGAEELGLRLWLVFVMIVDEMAMT